MIDWRAANRGSNGLMHGSQRLGDPVDHFLDGSRGNGKTQHGIQKLPNPLTAGPLHAAEFRDESAHPGAIAGRLIFGKLSGHNFAALRTAPLVEQIMGDIQLDFWKLNLLMGVESLHVFELAIPACALRRFHI